MNPVLLYLASTPKTAFFMGLCLALGLTSSILSIGFFTVLRHKALLYFGITMMLAYIVIGLMNQDPRHLLDVGSDPVLLRFMHAVAAVALYFYYLLVRSAFSPRPMPRKLDVTFRAVTILMLVSRGLIVAFPINFVIRIGSYTSIAFFLATMVFTVCSPASIRSLRLAKLGCCLFSAVLMLYPLIRAGIIRPIFSETTLPFLLVGNLATFSTLWLTGLVEFARELMNQAEAKSLRNMAHAFIQLRDLMNTPLQTIEMSSAFLRDIRMDSTEKSPTLDRIDRALMQMQNINAALTKYERNVDWEQTENFFEMTPDLRPV